MNIAAIFLTTLALASPAAAADGTPAPSGGKDVCLLYSRSCPGQGYPILEKIARLKKEIAKGTAVYTPAELKILENRLTEAEEILDLLNG